MEARQWDDSSETYEYDAHGLLSSVAGSGARAPFTTSYTFGEIRLVSAGWDLFFPFFCL